MSLKPIKKAGLEWINSVLDPWLYPSIISIKPIPIVKTQNDHVKCWEWLKVF